MAWIPAAIIGGTSLIGGLLDDSDDTRADASRDVAQIGARKSYPGQKQIASTLAPYLWENLETGLTEKEKTQYRSTGKTSILQQTKGQQDKASNILASQGLRGGRVADMLSRIGESSLPQFTKLENDIMNVDQAKKNKRIADILTFLSLQAGEEEDIGGAFKPGSVQDVMNKLLSGNPGETGYGGGTTGGFTGVPAGQVETSISSMIGSLIGGESDISVESSGVSVGPGPSGPTPGTGMGGR
jgi:hypothetical protein